MSSSSFSYHYFPMSTILFLIISFILSLLDHQHSSNQFLCCSLCDEPQISLRFQLTLFLPALSISSYVNEFFLSNSTATFSMRARISPGFYHLFFTIRWPLAFFRFFCFSILFVTRGTLIGWGLNNIEECRNALFLFFIRIPIRLTRFS